MNESGLGFDDSVAVQHHEPFSKDPPAAEREYSLLVSRHGRALLAFLATRAHRSDVEDLAQGVWTRIWQNRHSFQGGNFRAWMFKIARNYLIDEHRRQRPEGLEPDHDLADARQGGPLEILLDRERFERLNRCLERLDNAWAELLRGRLRNESYNELAQRLNLEAKQAHRLFHTAKQQLKDCVNQG